MPGVPRDQPRPPPWAAKLTPRQHVPDRLAASVENCVVLLRELRTPGYSGRYTILKAPVQSLQRRRALTATVHLHSLPGWL